MFHLAPISDPRSSIWTKRNSERCPHRAQPVYRGPYRFLQYPVRIVNINLPHSRVSNPQETVVVEPHLFYKIRQKAFPPRFQGHSAGVEYLNSWACAISALFPDIKVSFRVHRNWIRTIHVSQVLPCRTTEY